MRSDYGAGAFSDSGAHAQRTGNTTMRPHWKHYHAADEHIIPVMFNVFFSCPKTIKYDVNPLNLATGSYDGSHTM